MAEQDASTNLQATRPAVQVDVPFSSNAIRLSQREWVIALVIVAALFCLIPAGWERIEAFEPDDDYRVPYGLSDDYWMYSRHCRSACGQGRIPVIGDSVVWGHYVSADETLSHYLNEIGGFPRFANAGVDGTHPAALAGLIEYYGRSISGKKVVLHCNLLWMSSEKHDLQSEKEFAFNHPRLVPQFYPDIPCCKEPASGRISAIIERNLPFLSWTSHVRAAYLQNSDLPTWTLENPYRNPIGAVTLELPSPDQPPSPKPVAEPWTRKGIARINPSWVELQTSFQWSCFKRTVDILDHRGNRVFVLVGPFNEHMLKADSQRIYTRTRSEVEAWLQERRIACYIPPALPSDYYADASHPLSEGYAMLAGLLLENEAFIGFNGQPMP